MQNVIDVENECSKMYSVSAITSLDLNNIAINHALSNLNPRFHPKMSGSSVTNVNNSIYRDSLTVKALVRSDHSGYDAIR